MSLVVAVTIKGIDQLSPVFKASRQSVRQFGAGLEKLGIPTLERNLKAAALQTEAFNAKFAHTQALARGVGGALLVVGAAATGLAIGATKIAGDFEAAMTESLAIMGDAGGQMRSEMESVARDVATSTTFSAQQAAQSYYFLASAGLDAAQSMAALPQVANFAQAGMFDMARATDLLTDAQSALGLKSDDTAENLANMARISDVLVQANVMANASVEQFSEALTNRAGAALRLVNKDVEEGVAVLAALADQGVKGAEAGEGLSNTLRNLQRANIDAREEWEALGIAVFDEAGTIRNMADIIGDLDAAMAGMSDEQKRMTLMQLGFQDRALGTIQALMGTQDAIRQYEDGLRNAAGVTDEVAKRQLESMKAQLQLLKSAVADVGIQLGNVFVPIVKAGARTLQGFAAVVKAVVDNPLAKWLTVGALGIGMFAGAAGLALVGIGKLNIGLTVMAVKLGIVKVQAAAAWIAALGPIAWIIAGVVALGVAISGLVSWLRRKRDAAAEAQRALMDMGSAGEDAHKRIRAAQEKNETTARDVTQATEDLTNAEEGLTKAQKDRDRAQRDLSRAERDAVRERRDATEALQAAAQRVTDAEERAADRITKAKRRVRDADDDVRRAAEENARAIEDIETSAARRRESAERRLESALEARRDIDEEPSKAELQRRKVRDADRAVADAQRDLQEGEIERTRRLDELKQRIERDNIRRAEAQVDAAQELSKAETEGARQVEEAKKAQARALESYWLTEERINDGLVDSRDRLAEATRRLAAAEKALEDGRAARMKAPDIMGEARKRREAEVSGAAPVGPAPPAAAQAAVGKEIEEYAAGAAAERRRRVGEQVQRPEAPEDWPEMWREDRAARRKRADLARQELERARAIAMQWGEHPEFGDEARKRLAEAEARARRYHWQAGGYEQPTQWTPTAREAGMSGRQSGGPVTRHSPYLVGEAGPELFVPGTSGSVVPMGGGMGRGNEPLRIDLHLDQGLLVDKAGSIIGSVDGRQAVLRIVRDAAARS